MSQHDFEITRADANTGVSFRAQVNEALQALASMSSGAAAPTKPYDNQLWYDTANGFFQQRIAGGLWRPATPLLTVNKGANQSCSQDVLTKITFENIGVDSHGWFANSRYTPKIPGRYLVYGTLCSYEATPSTGNRLMAVCLVFNGAIIIGGAHSLGQTNVKTSDIMAVVPMNGSTDYLECHAWFSGVSGTIAGNYLGQVTSGFGALKLM